MNYEIERAISGKADEWKLNALRQEVEHLKNENHQLEGKITNAQNRLENQYRAIETLIRVIAESDLIPEQTNPLIELRAYL
jgi:hypothetical protein